MPYLGRSSVQQARPSTDARARPTIDLAKPSVKEDSGPPQRRRPSTNWLRTTSARLLGGGAGAVDRQFQEGPLPLVSSCTQLRCPCMQPPTCIYVKSGSSACQ